MPIHAHKLVASVAEGIAAELFEDLMSDNKTYARFKELAEEFSNFKLEAAKFPRQALRAKFIALAAPRLLEDARTTLAQMLRQTHDESLKETIAEALILDNELRGHREGPVH